MPGTTLLLYLVFFVGVVYFMLIRPQQKRQKHVQNLQNSLQLGDAVVTIGGLHGTIEEMNDNTLTIKSTDGTLLVFDREAIKYKNQSDSVEDTVKTEEHIADEIDQEDVEIETLDSYSEVDPEVEVDTQDSDANDK